MERITNKDTNKVCYDTWELCGLDSVCKRDCWKPTPCKIPKIVRRLAELEDRLEAGTLIELPCIRQTRNHKGQNVYRVYFINHGWGGTIDYYEVKDKSEAEKRLEELKR